MKTAQEMMNLKLMHEGRIRRKRGEAERREREGEPIKVVKAWLREASPEDGFLRAYHKISKDAAEQLKFLGYRVFTCDYRFTDIGWCHERVTDVGTLTRIFWDTRDEFVQKEMYNNTTANYTFFNIKEL